MSSAELGWDDCVPQAGPGVLPSFLTPFSQGTIGRDVYSSPRSWDELLPWDPFRPGPLPRAAVSDV